MDVAQEKIDIDTLNRHDLGETLFERLKEKYELKEALLGSNATMRYHERMVMLSVLDGLWKDHLLSMDHLKEGIGLRGVWAAGSPGGLQEGIVRHVRSDDELASRKTRSGSSS